jgi:hypothetical protein
MASPSVHESSLTKSTALSSYWREDMITPLQVITALNNAGVSFVLVGAYGLGGWLNEARATEDVDVIVAARHHKKAVQALLTAFPELEGDEHHVVTRLCDRQSKAVVIDVMKPSQQLLRDIFKHTKTVSSKGHDYRVPSLEMAIAMKFAAMISLHRRDKDKYQDAHDFIAIVEANPELDSEKLESLGEQVYPGGGAEVLELVRRAKAGEKLNL